MTVSLRHAGPAGLAGLAVLAFAVQASEPVVPGTSSATDPGAIQVFRAACLECHDSDGRGNVGRELFPMIPDFTDRRWQAARRDTELGHSILEGKGKSMPRMKNKLGAVDVGQMVALVRAFREGKLVVSEEAESSGRPAAAPGPNDLAVRQGSNLFQRYCVMCHGTDGRGSGMRERLPALPDFTYHFWQEARSDPQLVVSVLGGKGAGMPPFRAKLSRQQVRDLVAYVRSFAPSRAQARDTAFDEFETRFQQHVKEVEDLGRQIRALAVPSQSP
jgi:cytochrome c oxidase cbb3-type subunit 3